MSLTLFLDVDGVLNRVGHHPKGLESDKVEQLRWVVSATGCRLVISSTWRKTEHQRQRLMAMAEEIGAEIIGWTPVLEQKGATLWQAAPRWQEIAAWLKEHPEVTNYVILDDERLCAPLAMAGRVVQTDSYTGLTAAKAREVVALLSYGPTEDPEGL